MVMRIIFDCVILAAIALGQSAMATPARAFEPVAVLLGSAPVDSLPAYWAFLQASILNKVMTKSVFAKALGLAEKDVLGTRFRNYPPPCHGGRSVIHTIDESRGTRTAYEA